MLVRLMLASVLWSAGSAGSADAQEWTRFRGPNGTGVSSQTGLPTSWTLKDFAWKTPLPAPGHSSPVLWGNKIFVTGAGANGTRHAACVDAADGKLLWSKSFPGDKYKTHVRNSAATSTPVVDDRHVYLLWGSPRATLVQALTHSGELAWEADLGPYHGNHGIGVSLLRFGDLLIVPNDQDSNGSLVALEARTGARRWSLPRRSGNATYATPCVFEQAGRPPALIFTNWKHGITAVDPDAGKVVWEKSVFEPAKQERSVASPILAGDLIIGTCGFTTAQKHFVAVRPTPDGKVEEVWRLEKGVAHLPTPLVWNGLIFVVTEKGFASCLEAQSGKLVWQERVGQSFSASPVCAGGVIYAPSDEGEVLVLEASSRFQQLSRSPLGEATQATPAIAGGRVIFRTETHLMALGARRD